MRSLTAGVRCCSGCVCRALCSYTHPELGEGEGRRPCRSLRELKQLLAAARQLHFCDICLDSRKASPARHAVTMHGHA